jgi:hypothetical protein
MEERTATTVWEKSKPILTQQEFVAQRDSEGRLLPLPKKNPKDTKALRELFKGLTMTAAKVLLEILQDNDVRASDRIRAAEVVLDRGWGKAVQHIEVSDDIGGLIIMPAVEFTAVTLPRGEADAEPPPESLMAKHKRECREAQETPSDEADD